MSKKKKKTNIIMPYMFFFFLILRVKRIYEQTIHLRYHILPLNMEIMYNTSSRIGGGVRRGHLVP